MSEPLEIRQLPGPRSRFHLVLALVAIAGGLLLIAATIVALVVSDLDRYQRISAALCIIVGLLALGWGSYRLRVARRLMWSGVVLRLDDEGVLVVADSVASPAVATFPWSALETIHLAPAHLPPSWVAPDGPALEVMRFVVPDESHIVHDELSPYSVAKGEALGLTPLEAALTMIIGPSTRDRIPKVLEWLAINRPNTAVNDDRQSPEVT